MGLAAWGEGAGATGRGGAGLGQRPARVAEAHGLRTHAKRVPARFELGAALGLRVVAEGVEDEACWRSLAALGCDQAQGLHLAPPMEAERVTEWLRESARRVEVFGPAA